MYAQYKKIFFFNYYVIARQLKCTCYILNEIKKGLFIVVIYFLLQCHVSHMPCHTYAYETQYIIRQNTCD